MVMRRWIARLSLLIMLALTVWIFWPQAASATPNMPLVSDYADLLTPDEEAALAAEAKRLGDKYNMDVVVVTTRDTGGKLTYAYADDFLWDNGFGRGPDRDGVVYLIDMQHRQTYISTHGDRVISRLTDARIEKILDEANPPARYSDWNGSVAGFFRGLDNQLKPNSISLLDMLIGMGAASVLGGGFFAKTKRSYRGLPQPLTFAFRNNSIVSLPVISDTLVNTYTTSRIRPPPSSSSSGRGRSSGGSSTHTSSGGSTFGGGGRSF